MHGLTMRHHRNMQHANSLAEQERSADTVCKRAPTRFCSWERCSWHLTAMPVGMCFRRTHVDSLFTFWPPASDTQLDLLLGDACRKHHRRFPEVHHTGRSCQHQQPSYFSASLAVSLTAAAVHVSTPQTLRLHCTQLCGGNFSPAPPDRIMDISRSASGISTSFALSPARFQNACSKPSLSATLQKDRTSERMRHVPVI